MRPGEANHQHKSNGHIYKSIAPEGSLASCAEDPSSSATPDYPRMPSSQAFLAIDPWRGATVDEGGQHKDKFECRGGMSLAGKPLSRTQPKVIHGPTRAVAGPSEH